MRSFDEAPFIVIWELTQACDLACVRRNSVGAVNRAFTGIVRRQSQIQVPIIPLQQGLKVANTGVYVLLRTVGVIRSKSLSRRWNQLHQAYGALAGAGRWIPVRLRLDHRANQRRVNPVALGRFADQPFGAVPVQLKLGRVRPVSDACAGIYSDGWILAVALSLRVAGGSALTQKCLPALSTTLAIWALAGFPQTPADPKWHRPRGTRV